jgi:hypothetical protein
VEPARYTGVTCGTTNTVEVSINSICRSPGIARLREYAQQLPFGRGSAPTGRMAASEMLRKTGFAKAELFCVVI